MQIIRIKFYININYNIYPIKALPRVVRAREYCKSRWYISGAATTYSCQLTGCGGTMQRPVYPPTMAESNGNRSKARSWCSMNVIQLPQSQVDPLLVLSWL